jgi:hypothetical protein
VIDCTIHNTIFNIDAQLKTTVAVRVRHRPPPLHAGQLQQKTTNDASIPRAAESRVGVMVIVERPAPYSY